MISIKTVCDKCGNEIDGRVYRVSVDYVGDWRYSQMQMPEYLSYDICPECMKDVITEDIVGGKFLTTTMNATSSVSGWS